MNRPHVKLLSALLAVALAAAALRAQDTPAGPASQQAPTVDEIVKQTNRVAYYQGADGRAQVAMTVVDAQGKARQREMTILRWDRRDPKNDKADPAKDKAADAFCGEQKFYVYFKSPHDVAKTAFPTDLVYAPTLEPSLRLVTCGGAFDHTRSSYVDNVIVYAEP